MRKIIAGVHHSSVLCSFGFLICINDLSKYIKYFKAYYFADDANILQSNASLIDLATKRDHDLKKVYKLLKTNKFSVNFGKTKLIIFSPC